MGIEGLPEFIRNHFPSACGTISLDLLRGKKVAIDTYIVMYSNMAVARKKIIFQTPNPFEVDEQLILTEWTRLMLEFAIIWLSHGVVPVFVFDGEALPEKKQMVGKKRKSQKDKLRANIKTNEDLLSKTDILLQTPQMIENYRKALVQLTTLKIEAVNQLKELFLNIGLPCLKAKHDAEKLCSMLCREGKVSAVYSRDSDNLVYACPILLTKFADSSRGGSGDMPNTYGQTRESLSCDYINHSILLKVMNMTQEEFVDFCIMSGCDYNTNMSRIGVATSYKLIKRCKSIDLLSPKYDSTCLRYKRCRELFAYEKSSSIILEGDLHLDASKLGTSAREALDQVGLAAGSNGRSYILRLLMLYQKFPGETGGTGGTGGTGSSLVFEKQRDFQKRPEESQEKRFEIIKIKLPSAQSKIQQTSVTDQKKTEERVKIKIVSSPLSTTTISTSTSNVSIFPHTSIPVSTQKKAGETVKKQI